MPRPLASIATSRSVAGSGPCRVDTFQALAVLTRVQLLYTLLTGPLYVRDLALLVGVSESAVSHQLRYVHDRRMVKPRRAGNVMYYALGDTHVAVLFREADYHVDHVYLGLPDHRESQRRLGRACIVKKGTRLDGYPLPRFPETTVGGRSGGCSWARS